MSKEELIQELTDINWSFVNDTKTKLIDLSQKFNHFTSKYDKVYSELQQCKASTLIYSPGSFSWSVTLLFLGRLFVSESMSHGNQQLAYKCQQLKIARKITFYLAPQQFYKH